MGRFVIIFLVGISATITVVLALIVVVLTPGAAAHLNTEFVSEDFLTKVSKATPEGKSKNDVIKLLGRPFAEVPFKMMYVDKYPIESCLYYSRRKEYPFIPGLISESIGSIVYKICFDKNNTYQVSDQQIF